MKKIMTLVFLGTATALCAESLALSTEVSRHTSSSHIFSLCVTPPKLTPRQYDYLYTGNYASIYSESPTVKLESLITWISLYKTKGNQETLLWHRPVSQVRVSPLGFHVTDLGSVITLGDALGGCDEESAAIVVYEGTGQVLKSYTVSDILTKNERLELKSSPQCIWWSGIESSTGKKAKTWGELNEEIITIPLSETVKAFGNRYVSMTIKGGDVSLSVQASRAPNPTVETIRRWPVR